MGGPETRRIYQLVESGRVPAKRVEDRSRIYCLGGPESLTPHLNGEIYFQRWDAKAGKSKDFNATNLFIKRTVYDPRFQCSEMEEGDVYCEYGNWQKKRAPRRHRRFFGRMAHHLFLSNPNRKNILNVSKIKHIWDTEWLLTEMYRRALGSQPMEVNVDEIL